MNKLLTLKYFADRFGRAEFPIELIGGREMTIKQPWDSTNEKPVFSVMINYVWVGNVSYEHEFDLLYFIMSGFELKPFNEYPPAN